jgi:hypothetical protein
MTGIYTLLRYLVFRESEEDVAQDATPVAVLTNESQVAEDEMGTKVVTHPNQFTYSERAAQTLNNSYRVPFYHIGKGGKH